MFLERATLQKDGWIQNVAKKNSSTTTNSVVNAPYNKAAWTTALAQLPHARIFFLQECVLLRGAQVFTSGCKRNNASGVTSHV